MRAWMILLAFTFALGNAQAEDISVGIPKSDLDLSEYFGDSREPTLLKWELTTSFWKPGAWDEASFSVNTSPFEATAFPRLSLRRSTAPLMFEYVRIDGKFGLSYVGLRRKGHLEIAGQPVPVLQDAHLVSLQGGFELIPTASMFETWQPSYALALAPTWVQVASSELSAGGSRAELTLEHTAALTWWMRDFENSGLKALGIRAGFEKTQPLRSTAPTGEGVFVGLSAEM